MKITNTSDLIDCNIEVYRSSQYESFKEARKNKAAYYLTGTHGYSSTVDSIYNCCVIAECNQHDSSRKDIRAIIYVNGKRLEECFLADAEDSINSYLKSIQQIS